VDAIEGSEPPGSLYCADPEELLSRSAGSEGSGLGLLAMMPLAIRKRLAVFGVQPRNTCWGSALSREVIAAIPLLLPYLRAHILATAAGLRHLN